MVLRMPWGVDIVSLKILHYRPLPTLPKTVDFLFWSSGGEDWNEKGDEVKMQDLLWRKGQRGVRLQELNRKMPLREKWRRSHGRLAELSVWETSVTEWRRGERKIGHQHPRPLCSLRNAWLVLQGILRPNAAPEGCMFSRNRFFLRIDTDLSHRWGTTQEGIVSVHVQPRVSELSAIGPPPTIPALWLKV